MKCFVALFLILGVLTQQLIGQDIQHELVDELCECLGDEVHANMDAEDLKTELGLCMLKVTSGKIDEIKAQTGVDLKTEGGFKAFGKELGVILSYRCEKFVQMIFQAEEGKRSLAEEVKRERRNTYRSSNMFRGEVKAYEGTELLSLRVSQGEKEESFLCMGTFEGAELLQLKEELIGKEVNILYEIREIFQVDSFEFEERKVIYSISLN
ncbi:MAG: hypothetical protein AAF696_01500 [Bacteroidota bacterium]